MGFIRAAVYLFITFSVSVCQLVVNVRNTGGDVYRENIEANTTLDTILLEFRKSDGTLVTQFIDGRNEVQIFRVVILPEEELGQTNIQTICMVQRFTKNEFISSDAMSKLRQKNPSTIRHPEETRPTDTFVMDVLLNVAASHVLSTHIVSVCADASVMTYARSSDLQLLSQILNRDYTILQTITQQASTANLTSCTDLLVDSRQQQPCLCHYDICVGWYPCGLKYCRGKDSAGRIVSYRCGIKTCSRCRKFEFRVAAKHLCAWDEAEFQLPQPGLLDTVSGSDARPFIDLNGLPRSNPELISNVSVNGSGVQSRSDLGAPGNWNRPLKTDQGSVVDQLANGGASRYHLENSFNMQNDPKKHNLDDDEDSP
jgi:hypothetical protein